MGNDRRGLDVLLAARCEPNRGSRLSLTGQTPDPSRLGCAKPSLRWGTTRLAPVVTRGASASQTRKAGGVSK